MKNPLIALRNLSISTHFVLDKVELEVLNIRFLTFKMYFLCTFSVVFLMFFWCYYELGNSIIPKCDIDMNLFLVVMKMYIELQWWYANDASIKILTRGWKLSRSSYFLFQLSRFMSNHSICLLGMVKFLYTWWHFSKIQRYFC